MVPVGDRVCCGSCDGGVGYIFANSVQITSIAFNIKAHVYIINSLHDHLKISKFKLIILVIFYTTYFM